VSKSPVRDALQRLTGEGLVVQSDYRGVTVREISLDEADEIYALREVLEEMAVQLATPRLGSDDLLEAERCLTQAGQAIDTGDAAIVARINRDFHAAFSKRCGNRALHETLANLQNRVRIISVLGWRWRPSMHAELEQHNAILAAVRRGDAQTAGRLMREHIHSFRVAYREGQKGNRPSWPQALSPSGTDQ
jgi:DNA-binding GntR family transcriptional regulator